MDGFTNPTRKSFGAFRALPGSEPVHMLNLVRLRDKAVYEDGREATGAEAYAAYGRESGPIFAGLGGRIVWSGAFELMLIGPEDEQWDLCFVAEYPTADAFIAMVKDPEYQKAVVHHTAAVSDSRLVRTKPRTPGAGFGQ